MSGETQELTPQTLTALTEPYYNQLTKQGELRDSEVITDKMLAVLQKPVVRDANAVVMARLKQEGYRRKWAYKLQKKRDKRRHREQVRAWRRELVAARKAAFRAWWHSLKREKTPGAAPGESGKNPPSG